jgi:serine/threonine protein phosphatase PrpC
MSETLNDTKIFSATVTDRGLNERRPLNEDSFLADDGRHIFAVADGVGGAEAGEVASKTAIEVLGEAFRHQIGGGDIEDLMELAIQRANVSIYQMARDHAKLTNMATTIVALHVDGAIATIGHVGDSRLYRLTPDLKLVRETADHSIVEEEVRAGRMTEAQAANHPSKNVISRALGAEETVEVDLKTLEVEPGTSFLLCSDGITRHIPDNELRQTLIAADDLASACDELKRKCFERGAEDNLTAVIVRVGVASAAAREAIDGHSTLSFDYPPAAKTDPPSEQGFAGNLDSTIDALIPASRVAFPAAKSSASELAPVVADKPINIPEKQKSGGGIGRSIARVFWFLFFIAAAAAAFYGGTRYRGPLPFGLTRPVETPSPVTAPSPVKEDPLVTFEKARREVDRAPAEWLSTQLPKESQRQNIQSPLDSTEAPFLYLYGRAVLLAGGKDEEAAKAFAQAILRADQSTNVENSTIRKEAVLALAATTLKSNVDTQHARSHLEELTPKPSPPAK